ncbi:hypothetical protein C8J56DRAFT_1116439 [Mycena floridula]|nr:hypothetical protein C8J56DRAFT_1116439 [Mycena floridula]
MPQEFAHGRAQRHPRFYFPDGNVVFLVENTLYNLYRYFFMSRDSPVFRTLFSLPGEKKDEGDRQIEGTGDRNPIILEGISSHDFDRFLSVPYPLTFTAPENQTAEEWISVLNLASKWDFESIRELAIAHLELLMPSNRHVDRITVGHKYEISSWLVSAYMALCIREEPLSLEEGMKLGIEDTVRCGQVRHKIRYKSNLNRFTDTIREIVVDEFGLLNRR